MAIEVTHEQIYERLVAVEGKVDIIETNTKELVDAFQAVQGAFKVLGWIAKAAVPIIWVVGIFSTFTLFWSQVIKK
jgi:hypothetical protein